MEQLTKEQRNQVYKLAKEIFLRPETNLLWICPCIDDAGVALGLWDKIDFETFDEMTELFPEFLKFKPDNARMLWFENEIERLACLDKLIADTNP